MTATTQPNEPSNHVLVIGGGLTGMHTADQLASAGYGVSLIESGPHMGIDREARPLDGLPTDARSALDGLVDRIQSNGRIELAAETALTAASGFAGAFQVALTHAGRTRQQSVGAIVVATEPDRSGLAQEYGLEADERIWSQSRMEAELAGDSDSLRGKTVAFLAGFTQPSDPLQMERLMRSVQAANGVADCSVYAYVGDLKVAGDGLERLYMAGRNGGATYFKLTEIPQISTRDGQTVLAFRDPVLRRDVELAPDVLVVEEQMTSADENGGLAAALGIDAGPGQFLQAANVHRLPVATNREGIFVVGGGRDLQPLPVSFTDVDNALLEIKRLLGPGAEHAPQAKAVLDSGKCTFCLTCYRCCPHGAIAWAEDNRPIFNALACQGCGICASECPMDAIQIEGFQDMQLHTRIDTALAQDDAAPRIVAFCCQNSALEAGRMAAAFDEQLPAGLKLIEVPCAGKVDLEYILRALSEGADGVLVIACHPGNCKSENGNTYAGWRVDDAHRILGEVGLEPERLVFTTLAANMGGEFAKMTAEFEAKLRELGSTPLKN